MNIIKQNKQKANKVVATNHPFTNRGCGKLAAVIGQMRGYIPKQHAISGRNSIQKLASQAPGGGRTSPSSDIAPGTLELEGT